MDFIDRMRSGQEVRCTDGDNGPFYEALSRARVLCDRFNTPGTTVEEGFSILDDLLECRVDRSCIINPTFRCDLGSNISLGKGVKINCDCVILDCADVTIGDYTMIGPKVQIITPNHPMDHMARRE